MGPSVTPPPLFFISYVHDSGEDDTLVHRFYQHLNHDVLMFAGRRQTETAGFCDVSFQLGQRWSPTLIENLSTTQVFIPVMSPVYFHSEACGKEWAIFMSRLTRSGQLDSPKSSIIPLLWVPTELPTIVLPFQFREAAFGVDYEQVKLRSLIREERRRDAYYAFVQQLAQRVVDLSKTTVVAEAQERPGFDDVASAFDSVPDPRPPHPHPGRPAAARYDRPILNTNLSEEPR